jgi:uncharacterized protein YbjT (DUF2867 family)
MTPIQERDKERAGPILVTGGTGTLGRRVVAVLRRAARNVRMLTREAREPRPGVEFATGDLQTGERLGTALEGIETILHLAGSAKGDEEKARHLVDAVPKTAAPHLVHISVVGCDRVPVGGRIDRAMFGYYAAKLAAERVVATSGLPWTTLRSTQFHELILTVAEKTSKLPVVPYPSRFKAQPVDAGEVAERLVALALGPPSGLAPDVGGPRVYRMEELLRHYLSVAGKRRALLPVPAFGNAAGALRDGANLVPERTVGHVTWEEFLASRVEESRRASDVGAIDFRLGER